LEPVPALKTIATPQQATVKHLAAGVGMRKVAKTLGVGVSTVQRVKAEMRAVLER
jgi:transposase